MVWPGALPQRPWTSWTSQPPRASTAHSSDLRRGVLMRGSLHRARRPKADPQLEHPTSRLRRQALDGRQPSVTVGSFLACQRPSLASWRRRSSSTSSPTWLFRPGRRRGLRRMGGRCKRPERSQLIAAGAARCSGPGGAAASGVFRTGARRPDLGPTTSAAALRPPGSGRRQVPPRRRWPPAPRGRRLHAPAWRPRRWRRRPSWRWTRSPAGASGR